jgi:putative phosphoesterase
VGGEVHRTVALTDDAPRVAVVADTHSAPHPDALTHLRTHAPAFILHAGDIGDASVIDTLSTVAPVIPVRGNIDPRGAWPDHVHLQIRLGSGAALPVLLTHIAVRGPRLRADARRVAARSGAALVVCGHSHVPLLARDRDVAIFNPGSIGPRRFQLPITFGVMDFASGRLVCRHFDCETGAMWQPPEDPTRAP